MRVPLLVWTRPLAFLGTGDPMLSIRLLMIIALAASGCAAGTRADGTPNRSFARNLLIGVALGSAALAVGSAVAGAKVERDLRSDLDAGGLSGREFAELDADGRRWNRLSRAATFASGLSVLGVAIVWQMGVSDRMQLGPRAPSPEERQPIFPPSPTGLPVTPPAPGQGSSTAR
jgi:hypothetical protein